MVRLQTEWEIMATPLRNASRSWQRDYETSSGQRLRGLVGQWDKRYYGLIVDEQGIEHSVGSAASFTGAVRKCDRRAAQW